MTDPDYILPTDLAWLFPEYIFQEMTLTDHEGVIIERILDRGTWEQVRWLFSILGEDRVRVWVQHHGYRLLSKRSFALWCLALEIREYQAPDWAIEAKELEPW